VAESEGRMPETTLVKRLMGTRKMRARRSSEALSMWNVAGVEFEESADEEISKSDAHDAEQQ
jgi:hypothetical protein